MLTTPAIFRQYYRAKRQAKVYKLFFNSSLFNRDIYKDLAVLEKAIGEGDENASNLDMFSLEMFENIAYIMAKHADMKIPDTPEEWLDEFNTFSIYQVLPKIIELWGINVKTEIEAKKTSYYRTGNDNSSVYAAVCADRAFDTGS